jgi:hypothetical protein
MSAIMENYKNSTWTELSDEQRTEIKEQVRARCAEQGLPGPGTPLIKALVLRIHDGALGDEKRSLFVKRQPASKPASTLLPLIRKVHMPRHRDKDS